MNVKPASIINAPSKNPVDEKLKKACKEFEGVLVSQMLKSMRATVPKSNFFGSDEEEGVFRDMLDNETARNAALSGSFGLADSIYSQLAPKNSAKVGEKPVDTVIGKTEE